MNKFIIPKFNTAANSSQAYQIATKLPIEVKPEKDMESLLDANSTIQSTLQDSNEGIEEPHEIFTKLDELKNALLLLHPTMPQLLHKIHRQLSQDPAIVTLLSEENIATLIEALKVQTNTELITVSTSKRTKKESITLDDI